MFFYVNYPEKVGVPQIENPYKSAQNEKVFYPTRGTFLTSQAANFMTIDGNLYDLLRLWQQEVRKTADCLHEYNFAGAIECSNKAIAIGESVLSRLDSNSLEDDED